MRRLSKVIVLTLAGLTLGGGSAYAADLNEGRSIAGAKCRVCHGVDGVAAIPVAPHIGGEPAAYLAAQIRAFRSGEREHEMMNVVAKELSDDAIDAVTLYYAALEPKAVQAFAKAGAAAPEDCSGCHGENGISVVEDAPNLAGENEIYIMTQIKAFRTGQRSHEIMSEIAETYTDAELYPAAEWYASFRYSTTAPK